MTSLHSIVAQLNPNAEQLPAIVARSGDFVLDAGAGTGKTRTLVARYLALLAEGAPLHTIVAITFTNRAAQEMRNRVRKEINGYLQTTGLTEVERVQWQTHYRELDAARISTIHALCTEILRRHSAEAAVDPGFAVLDENISALLQVRAVEAALTWAADDQDAFRLFTLFGEPMLRALLRGLLAERARAAQLLHALPANLLAHWTDALAELQKTTIARLLASSSWRETISALRQHRPLVPDDLIVIQHRTALAAIDALDRLATAEAVWQVAANINLRGGSGKAWPGGKDEYTEVKARLTALKDTIKAEGAMLTASLNAADAQLAEALPLLRMAFDQALADYEHQKQLRGALDYDDLEERAGALLRDNATVRGEWQATVTAVLVDEFQDTNTRQRDLVRSLCGNAGNLFVVGDAKQSIYRFRGAEVQVFRAEREQVAARKPANVGALRTSYRTHRPLLNGLNGCFRALMGEQEDAAQPWKEPFAPLEAHLLESVRRVAAPHIDLLLTIGSKGDDALDLAADALVDHLIALVQDPANGVNLDDIVILCRASSSFSFYEDALERANVPFVMVAGAGFYQRPEIRAVLNALRAIANPHDDLALIGLLRSPVVGCDDTTIARLRAEDKDAPLWSLVQSATALPLRYAVDLIEQLQPLCRRHAAVDVLKAFLDRTHYAAVLLGAGQTRAARNLDRLLEEADSQAIVGIDDFLTYVDNLRSSGGRTGEARTVLEGAVQLMTVHQAKGLEFPVVVLGDANYNRSGTVQLLLDDAFGVAINLEVDDEKACVFQLVNAGEKQKEAAESERLLYVAATRAQDKLIISGCFPSLKKSNQPGSLSGWLRQLAAPIGLADATFVYDADGSAAHHVTFDVDECMVGCTLFEPHVRFARRLPSMPPPVDPTATWDPGRISHLHDDQVVVDETPNRVWRIVPPAGGRAPAWVVGQLVHTALAHWRFPDATFDAWAAAQAQEYGLVERAQLLDAAARARQLLLRFRAHPLYETINGAARRLHEVPYTLPDTAQSGRIDLLFESDGSWQLVDFKIDALRGATAIEALLADSDYLAQLEGYVAALHDQLGIRAQAQLCFLDHDGTVTVYTL